MTRPSKWSQLKLVCRLWKDNEGKAAYVDKFAAAIKPDPAYVAEMAAARKMAYSKEMRDLYLEVMKKPMPDSL